jgi:hypothetical protein
MSSSRSVARGAAALNTASPTSSPPCPRAAAGTRRASAGPDHPRARRGPGVWADPADHPRARAAPLDIEHISLVARAPIDAALHALELSALDLLPDGAREERGAILWTAKEAVLKATGHGLNVDPSMLALDVAADGAVELIAWPDVLGLGSAPPINIFRPDADVIGALAVLAPHMPETLFEWLPPA